MPSPSLFLQPLGRRAVGGCRTRKKLRGHLQGEGGIAADHVLPTCGFFHSRSMSTDVCHGLCLELLDGAGWGSPSALLLLRAAGDVEDDDFGIDDAGCAVDI